MSVRDHSVLFPHERYNPASHLIIAVFEGGFSNFLSIYNVIITARILLSWFPQAQGIGVLQPVFTTLITTGALTIGVVGYSAGLTKRRGVVTAVLLVLVLLVRPTGILGESLGKARV